MNNINNYMEDCINLDNYINESDIFQIQIDDKTLIIKKIGKSKSSNDITICKNVGIKKNISLFSIVYTQEELDYYYGLGNIYNLLKLHEKTDENNKLFNLSVKINEKIEINKTITDFEIFFISNKMNKTFNIMNDEQYFKKYDKIINKNNIVETMFSEYLELI
jgi:hypothetical protein